ncbi:MAG: cache domain-containing protein [Gammaproteobacteria bacterium]|nr:cache domain-containing protein [Gammaproteobacteria bacterium]
MIFKKTRARINKNLRYKLLILVLLPVFIVMPVILVMAAYWSQSFSYQQLFMKVSTDLSVTHDAFYQQQKNYLSQLEKLAESYVFRNSLNLKDSRTLNNELSALKNESHFDFLHLIDLSGNWLNEAAYLGYTKSKHSVLFSYAKSGQPESGIEIFSQEDLAREKSIENKQLRLTLIDTPHAVPIEHKVEDRGMMLRMVYPVRDATGSVIAILDGGVLLNRNFKFVDSIRDLVYAPGSLMSGSLGTVTVFIDDVRISTNVLADSGERALGTRVSKEVRSKVLDLGEKWIDRAFVVNNWYVSAYEPIYDVGGQRVGILYAGFLETPFSQIYRNALLILFLLFFIVTLLSSWFAIRGAKSIFKPIEQMMVVVRGTHSGKQLRIGDVDSDDEIGELAKQFDTMLDQLHDHNLHILHAAEMLEYKVEERTKELQTKNEALEKNIQLLNETRKQLVLAEKLASLGELTAGIAHEINNPTAVILGNMELMLAEMGEKMNPVKHESDLIIEQVYRIRTILESLLQYSRSGEASEYVDSVNVNQLIEDTLPLVKHEVETHHIGIKLDLKADISVKIHKQELQQVIINLIVNAVQASCDESGRLEIESNNWDDKGVVIIIRDNGVGISEHKLSRVFDPFYTTKQSGTGLGLSVSFGLVQRYGGSIKVENNPDAGSCFSIFLLHEPEQVAELQATESF